ncbi:ferrous iron transport protein B [Chloroflexota bacterium]
MSKEEIRDARDKSSAHLKSIFGDEAESVIAEARYGFISGLLKETLQRPPVESVNTSDKVDRVIIHQWAGVPIFFIIMFGVFQLTFTASGPLMQLISNGFGWIAGAASHVSPAWLGSLLADGVLAGVGTVLTFIPPIFLLFLALALLEDCGYLARAAFIMDRLMHRIGLHGRSFIPLLIGFGCNVPAIMATRTIENPKDRLVTILINPLMSCGGRLPIYILIAGAFFTAYQGLVVFSMYGIGIAMAILMTLVFRKWLITGPSGHFVMELPPYRLPTFTGVAVHVWERGREFIKRAGTIILAGVVVVWLLSSMPWGVEYGSAQSLIGRIGSTFAPIFSPLGFGQWQASVGIISGFVAKEQVVGVMATLFGVGDEMLGATMMSQLGWTPLVAYAFMAFCLIYVPCLATMTVIKSETASWKWVGFSMVYSVGLAWIVALIIYQVGIRLGLG